MAVKMQSSAEEALIILSGSRNSFELLRHYSSYSFLYNTLQR